MSSHERHKKYGVLLSLITSYNLIRYLHRTIGIIAVNNANIPIIILTGHQMLYEERCKNNEQSHVKKKSQALNRITIVL
jgi:hypothetical protein